MIVDAGHLDHVASADVGGRAGAIVVQPEDRGTAAGVLLALTPVLESSPDAVVAITPADHGVRDDARFRRGVIQAARRVRRRDDIVLFAVEPSAAEQDYGWISLGAAASAAGFRAVEAFVEKPDGDAAARLFDAGAVWNTMVIVARAAAIRDLHVRLLPDLAAVFAAAMSRPAADRAAFLAAVYPGIPRYDFSRDLLTRARSLQAFVWPASLGWSDLGTPGRVHQWHRCPEGAPARADAVSAA